MARTIAYLRVSTINQAEDGAGLDAQLDACNAWAVARGLELAEVHQDAGVSGAKQPHERLGLMAAIASLEPGDTLLVYRLDRIARDMMSAMIAEDLVRRQNARIISAAGESTENDDPTSQFCRQVLVAVAQLERSLIKARLMAGRNAKKARGHKTTGIIPYGFKADAENAGKLVKDDQEQAVLAEIAGLRAAGLSLRDIAADLAKRGTMARNGKPFSAKVLNDLLKRNAA